MQAQKTFLCLLFWVKTTNCLKNVCNITLVDKHFYNGTAINLREHTSTESFSHLPLTFFHYVERGRHERFTILRTCICFRMCLPPDPIQCHFIWKNRTWNSKACFDELSWWSSSPRPQSTSNLQKILDWIIFALALGADGPCAQVNSFRWHWLGSGGTHEKNTVPHCEVLVHSVPYFSITFITLFKSFSKSF